MNKLITALILVATAATAQAGEIYKKEEKQMSYSECLARIKQLSSAIPTKVVLYNDLITTVRFQTSEGSLLATCSNPDRKMSLIYTTNPF